MPEILYKSKNFIVINKPAGIPSQSDLTGDADAMTLSATELREAGERDELYLVHRLDRVVGGAMVFARNKRAAAEISKILTSPDFSKRYLAVVEGEAPGGVLTDYIYKDSRTGKAFIKDRASGNAKYAELSYERLSENGGHTLISVRLATGRFHQIRVQLSSRGAYIVGDGKYGSRDVRAKMPALFAYWLTFSCLGEHVDVKVLPSADAYPWCEFDLGAVN